MKKTLVKLILVSLFLTTAAITPALADGGGGLPPLCYPKECPVK